MDYKKWKSHAHDFSLILRTVPLNLDLLKNEFLAENVCFTNWCNDKEQLTLSTGQSEKISALAEGFERSVISYSLSR